jgi:uncharacterized coiled-coil DUF342 family protein
MCENCDKLKKENDRLSRQVEDLAHEVWNQRNKVDLLANCLADAHILIVELRNTVNHPALDRI